MKNAGGHALKAVFKKYICHHQHLIVLTCKLLPWRSCHLVVIGASFHFIFAWSIIQWIATWFYLPWMTQTKHQLVWAPKLSYSYSSAPGSSCNSKQWVGGGTPSLICHEQQCLPCIKLHLCQDRQKELARPAFAYILCDGASSRNAFSWKLCTTSTNKPEQSWIAGGVLLVLLGVLNLTCTDSLSLTETHKLVMVSLTLAQIHLVSSRIAQIHSDH